MSASTSSLGTFSILNVAIAQAQALAEKVSHLPPGRERDGWDRERVDVSALLAYKNIETCEVRGYFDETRKEALAEMVNAAVLRASLVPHLVRCLDSLVVVLIDGGVLERAQSTRRARRCRSFRSRPDKPPPSGRPCAR